MSVATAILATRTPIRTPVALSARQPVSVQPAVPVPARHPVPRAPAANTKPLVNTSQGKVDSTGATPRRPPTSVSTCKKEAPPPGRVIARHLAPVPSSAAKVKAELNTPVLEPRLKTEPKDTKTDTDANGSPDISRDGGNTDDSTPTVSNRAENPEKGKTSVRVKSAGAKVTIVKVATAKVATATVATAKVATAKVVTAREFPKKSAQTGVEEKNRTSGAAAATRKRSVKGGMSGDGEDGEKVKRPTRAEAKLARQTSTTSFAMEQNMFDLHDSVAYVAGWDEVGRGPYFGPVISCVCVVARGAPLVMNVYDSKKYHKQKKKGPGAKTKRPTPPSVKKERSTATAKPSGGGGGGGGGSEDLVEEGCRRVDDNAVTVKKEVGVYGAVKSEAATDVDHESDKIQGDLNVIGAGDGDDEHVDDERERLCDVLLKAPGHYFRISRREAHEIDAIGNMRKVMEEIMCDAILNVRPQPDAVFVDGYFLAPQLRAHPQFQAWPIIKGDSHCYTIAAASIVAKVTRDREIRRLARAYPHYGLENHMGYGSYEHEMALYKYGMTDMHRKSFQPMRNAIARGGVFLLPKSRARATKRKLADPPPKTEPQAPQHEEGGPDESQ